MRTLQIFVLKTYEKKKIGLVIIVLRRNLNNHIGIISVSS